MLVSFTASCSSYRDPCSGYLFLADRSSLSRSHYHHLVVALLSKQRPTRMSEHFFPFSFYSSLFSLPLYRHSAHPRALILILRRSRLIMQDCCTSEHRLRPVMLAERFFASAVIAVTIRSSARWHDRSWSSPLSQYRTIADIPQDSDPRKVWVCAVNPFPQASCGSRGGTAIP